MSLVIASSSQNEFDTIHATNVGIENPASFQNFFRSPLKIEANSEVALISLKCNRRDDDIVIKNNEGFYLYWGSENPNNGYGGSRKFVTQKADDINSPLAIKLLPGVYTPGDFVTMLQGVLDDVVKKAYAEIKTITVSEVLDGTSKQLKQFSIAFEQIGNGSALNNIPAHTDFEPTITTDTYISLSSTNKIEADKFTDNFVPSASGSEVIITGHNPSATGTVAECIGKRNPLSLVRGKCIMYFNGSVSAGTNDGYTLGLVRSQGYTSSTGGTQRNYVTPSGVFKNPPTLDSDVLLPDPYQAQTGDPKDDVPFWWDVCFNWVNGQDPQVLHLVKDPQAGFNGVKSLMMRTIELAPVSPPTNASMVAKYYDRVIFETIGERVKVSIGISGSSTEVELVDGLSTGYGQRVKPLGITCNQLYPKISIHNNDSSNPGVARLNTWGGHDKDNYYDSNVFGYGMDGFKPGTGFRSTISLVDRNSIYSDGTINDGSTLYTYKEDLNGDKGINYKWSMLFSTSISTYYTSINQKIVLANGIHKVSDILGFDADIIDQTTYATTSNDGHIVTFKSINTPESVITSSMFVRLKNQALNSYNGIKSSVSNIIYSCPRFDANGNSKGLLWFSPPERVYVKFNNPTDFVLNSLDLDIVDLNEKPLEDLIGNTLITLHIRKSRD